MNLAQLGVAMVEPQFGLNVGYVARAMKNFGVCNLVIVGRKSVPRSALRFASHGADVVRNARYVGLNDLRGMFDVVMGTTAIAAKGGRNPVRKTVTPERLASLSFDPAHTVILLGRDTTGLTAEELDACDIVVSIPTGTAYSTLNISHALAILLYSLNLSHLDATAPVKRIYLDRVMAQYSKMLGLCGYPGHKRHLATKIMQKAMIQSRVQQEEIVTMMGVFRKANLALERRF
jgi:tRNA/rRNA methyltransferase